MAQPILRRTAELTAFRLRDGATNKMVPLLTPGEAGTPASVNVEIFDVGGRQNPNSHPGSAELFYFISGTGLASCDGTEVAVQAGDFLILPAGSVHFIANTGDERLYALTTLLHDDGSHDGTTRPHENLLADDLAVLGPASGSH